MSSLCALNCDAFNVPLGAANLDLSSKGLGAAAAILLAGVIKGNTTIISLKCVQPRISHMVAQCLRWSQAPSLVVLASNRPLALAFASGPADTPALSPSPLCLSCTVSTTTTSAPRAHPRSPPSSRRPRSPTWSTPPPPECLLLCQRPLALLICHCLRSTFRSPPPFVHRLRENRIGAQGASALAEGLKSNSTLKELK